MRKHAWILAAAVTASLSSFGLAQSAPTSADAPDVASLKAQIDLLQRQVEKIQVQQAQQTEINLTTASVAADAARQSQMLQTMPFLGGYNNGFKIQSADGNFVMQPGLVLQFRNITNYNSASDDVENGFEFRRLRPRIDGVVFTKDLAYSVVLDTGRNVGTVIALDAWFKYNIDKTWSIKAGQFRNSWVHEGDVSDTRQLAVERSLIDATLGGGVTDRVQGIEIGYGQNDLPYRGAFSFNDGENSKNTDFRDSDGGSTTTATPGTATGSAAAAASAARVDSNFGVSGRFDYKIFGDWKSYTDFTAKNTKEDTLIVGGGVFVSQNGDATITRATADAQYNRVDGWTTAGQFVYTYNGTDDSSNYGAGAQVGYLINPKVEVFGRYSYLNFEEDINGESNFHEITAGGNYYFGPDGAWSHNLKFSLDLNYLPTGSPGNQTGVGYLAGDDSQVVLRAQFQLVL